MRKYTSKFLLSVLALAFMVLTTNQSVIGQVTSGQKVKISGLITARNGASLIVKTAEGENVVVNIADYTAVKVKKGPLGVKRDSMAVTSLIPGLKVDVDGLGNDKGQVDAKSIEFSSS